jgi:DNA-binding CsgD family transcriptional regulator
LVGRTEELDHIAQWLHGPSPAALIVSGEAGVGKTRLLRETLEVAQALGCADFWATATRAAASIPFGALSQLLPEPADEPESVLGLLRRAGIFLTERAEGKPVVLAVDDAHLLDDASATLVHQFTITGRARVLLSVRSGEPTPDAVTALWKDGLAEYIELQALSREALEQLVAEVLGGFVSGTTQVALWEATRGNALFVRELVIAGLERGVLRADEGIWRWHGPVLAGVRLEGLVRARLDGLDDEELSLLRFVGRAGVLGKHHAQWLLPGSALESLLAKDLLEVRRSGRREQLTLAHPLYDDALRTLSRSAPAADPSRLAATLQATGARRREDPLQIALLLLEAGAPARPNTFLVAARRALAFFDGSLAELLARAAAAAGGAVAAHQLLGRALAAQGRGEEADRVLAELEASALTDRERAMVAEARSTTLFWSLGRPEEAELCVSRARDAITDRELRDELTIRGAWFSMWGNRKQEALRAVRKVIDRPGAGERACVMAAILEMIALVADGAYHAAEEAADRWAPVAERVADEFPIGPTAVAIMRVSARWTSGRLISAEALVQSGYDEALAAHALEPTAIWARELGGILAERGRLVSAIGKLHEAAALFREVDSLSNLPWALILLGRALGQAGDGDGAEAVLAEAESTRQPAVRMMYGELGLARAWATAASGDLSTARELALHASDTNEQPGNRTLAARALHDLARLGDPATASERLDALVPHLDGPAGPAYAAHAAALAAGDGAGLDAAAETFEGIGAMLLAAEAATEAAAAHAASGRAASSARSRLRAAAALSHCEGAGTPALIAGSPIAELSERERQVASLAAAGLSNGEIAARLVLSTRTVENHLYRVFDKLDLSQRDQLSPLFHAETSGVYSPTQGS